MIRSKNVSNSQTDWWRDAVIYQIYPRSFADGNGDGVGDLPGIIDRLPEIADLGVDAIWLSPFYTSPQRDAGYDVTNHCDVDPVFGTLGDAERLISSAHSLGLRIIIDIVPNHTSSQHPWFRAALASPPGSPERNRYIFRDGKGENGQLPPNNWQSVFGGAAWTRITDQDGTDGQWYLHLFDSSQPDLNWDNPEVWEFFRRVLRFWLDREVDGFRVDVAHGLIKETGLPDSVLTDERTLGQKVPHWDQERVHDVYRDWRTVLDAYGPDKMMCAEAWVFPLSRMARYARSDEMNQAFNFSFLSSQWDTRGLRGVIEESLEAFGAVGAPSTWVLSNHDVVRHASRYGLSKPIEGEPHGIGPNSSEKPDEVSGLRIGRAATALMLALPGSAYLYQGEELGLPEVIDIPDGLRTDPTFFRTGGKRYGRDGCRVPIPWESDKPSYGFSATGASWLPQPKAFSTLARDAQAGRRDSTLELYRKLLGLRAKFRLGSGTLEWLEGYGDNMLVFRNNEIGVFCNLDQASFTLPSEALVESSGVANGLELHGNCVAWLLLK